MTKKELKQKLDFHNIDDDDILHFAGVTDKMVMSTSRKREIVMARDLMMVNLWANTSATLTKVGKLYGKDHATIIYSIKKVSNALDGYNNNEMVDLIKAIRTRNTSMKADVDNSVNEMIALINLESRIYNLAV